MLVYRNGRLYCGNVSFKLPNEICVDTQNSEICENGIHLCAPDKSFIIQVEFKPGKKNAYEELSHYFNGQLSYLLIGEIEKISAGGLCGYKAKYEDKRTVNEEYIFDIPNSRMFNLLDIYIMIKKSSITYDESYKNRIVAEMLDGIESN